MAAGASRPHLENLQCSPTVPQTPQLDSGEGPREIGGKERDTIGEGREKEERRGARGGERKGRARGDRGWAQAPKLNFLVTSLAVITTILLKTNDKIKEIYPLK